MAKQTRTPKTPAVSNELVHFISSTRMIEGPGQLTEHSGLPVSLTRKTEEVKNDFILVMNQLNFIVAAADKDTLNKGFKLNEITISLGFSAKGKIAFIAEAGVEASIEVKFSRR